MKSLDKLFLPEASAKGFGRAKSIAPPAIAEFFISFLAPKGSGQAFLGDLQEMFQKNVDRFGEQQARRKYSLELQGRFCLLSGSGSSGSVSSLC
jgi:hypothetical protein